MRISRHAVERYQERITPASYEFTTNFIKEEVKKSELLYSVNGVEKRTCSGIVYIIDRTNQPTVVTLYLELDRHQ